MKVAGAYQNEREDKNLVLHLGKRQGTNERKIKRSTRKEKNWKQDGMRQRTICKQKDCGTSK